VNNSSDPITCCTCSPDFAVEGGVRDSQVLLTEITPLSRDRTAGTWQKFRSILLRRSINMDLDELRVKNALRCTLLSYSKNAGATLDLLRGLHCRWGGGFVARLIAVPLGRQSRAGSFDVFTWRHAIHSRVFRPD